MHQLAAMFTSSLRSVLVVPRRMAGHSKWANIKHIKGAKDAERAATNQRIFRQVRAVIREFGSNDPKKNLPLAHLLEQARQYNIPADKIQEVLKNTESSKDDLKPYVLEVRGPGGSFFVIEIQTNNITKTKHNINYINKKNYGAWADGIANHVFTHKGIIKVKPLEAGQTFEAALDHAIEVGAEDVTDESEYFVFICDAKSFYPVFRSVALLGYKIVESDVLYMPNSPISLGETEIAPVKKLNDKLHEDPDVVRVYSNVEEL